MHQAVLNFVSEVVSTLPPRRMVVEYGGRWINGGVRDFFTAPDYVSIDLVPGTNVDLVADAVTYRPTGEQVPDTVICCEVLEHSKHWPEIVKAAGAILDPEDGILILTCATKPRSPHSGYDGGQVREMEYYKNVDPMELTQVLDTCFGEYDIRVDDWAGDIYVLAWKQEVKA